jgi:hypothetical protein
MIKKTLTPTNDMYMQFTEDELAELNMAPGDKFSVKHLEDGSIKLEKYVKMEVDMGDWPREVLEQIISMSCEEDISANEVISNLLKKSLETVKTSSTDVINDFMKGKHLLNETYHNTEVIGKEYNFPTPWNVPPVYATTEDVLPEHRTHNSL